LSKYDKGKMNGGKLARQNKITIKVNIKEIE